MNCSCYLYGSFDNSYVQYPNDDTKKIFNKGIEHCQCNSDSQLIIHREERQMYYSFVQRLANKWPSYVGVTIVLSDLVITDIEGMFILLQNSITRLAVSGKILDFGNGGIISKVKSLSNKSTEMSYLFKELMNDMNRMDGALSKLPPIKYGIDKDTYIHSKLGDNCRLYDLSQNYGFLIISKDESQKNVSDIQKTLSQLDKKSKRNDLIAWYVSLTSKDKIIISLIAIVIFLITIIILR